MAADRKQIVPDSYAAFAAGDRSFFEERLSDDFLFSAPPDPKLDRDGYWERGLARRARWLGASAAPDLHRFYCAGIGYLPPLASSLALYSAPTGPQASLAAARITGAEFGKSESRRQAFRRTTPLYKDRFTSLTRSRARRRRAGASHGRADPPLTGHARPVPASLSRSPRRRQGRS